VVNKCGKFCAKICLHCIDIEIAIFALGIGIIYFASSCRVFCSIANFFDSSNVVIF